MSVSREEMEELREDLMQASKDDCDHECYMRSDIDYFLAKSNYYNNALDSLIVLKSEATMYNRCIHDLIDTLKDEL